VLIVTANDGHQQVLKAYLPVESCCWSHVYTSKYSDNCVTSPTQAKEHTKQAQFSDKLLDSFS